MEDYLNSTQLKNLLKVFPVIEKAVNRYARGAEKTEKEDIAQTIKLKLLNWKRNRPHREYSLAEWLKITNKACRNEVLRFFSRKPPPTVPLENLTDEQIYQCPSGKKLTTQLEGNTNMELHLQVKLMWETIKTQSLLENCALLLKNHELASYLIFNHGCRIAEMAKQLQLTETELSGIIELIPLSDLEIANYLLERFQLKATPAAIRKARQRATDQLRQAVKGKQLTKKNGRTSENGKT